MTFQQRVNAIVQLGHSMRTWASQQPETFHQAYVRNNWFTVEEIKRAASAWASQLAPDRVNAFLKSYSIKAAEPKTIAIIMAGNVPFVGLHDLLMVVLSGNRALVKTSSEDDVLMRLIINELIRIEPQLAECITISNERLPKEFDAVIATGSNNTFRYFEYYFKNKPAILRKSRSSVAVLSGNETKAELADLGNDIFSYFGLGCRNISKLYVPEHYDFTLFFESIESFNPIIHHNKYANNYTYHKSIFLMNMTKHLDNGFLIVKSDERIASPLSVLFYQEYSDLTSLKANLNESSDHIQCVVSTLHEEGWQALGQAQCPLLSDFADGTDTLEFLLTLS